MIENMTNTSPNLEIASAQIELLKQLCHAVAVTGDEQEVRTIIKNQVKPFADEIKTDAMGNLLVQRYGTAEQRLRVMLSAHMDEVGFMIVDDNKDGFFQFGLIGGIDPRQLVSKAVLVGREHIPGVIDTKPIHLTTREERKQAFSLEGMRIDVGSEQAAKVKVGDRGTFATPFEQIGPSFRAKALDNRLGVALLIELLKIAPPNIDLLAAFTVQEEIGARGAATAAYAFHPDLAIAVDATPANDLPTWDLTENMAYNTRLGAGPAIYMMDSGTISDPRLVRFFSQVAETHRIHCQIRQPGGGGTDAMAIHRQRGGIPSISISTPCRYTHTAMGIVRVEDWQNALRLVYTGLAQMSLALLENSTN